MTDFRNAVRTLLTIRSFSIAVVAVMTLGIGASTAVFSLVDAVVLRGVPFPNGFRLVALGERNLRNPSAMPGSVAPQNFLDWRAQQSAFEDLAAVAWASGFSVSEGFQAERLRALRVTASLFAVLGAKPALGQVFSIANEILGNERVAVISDGLWRRSFGGDRNVLGKSITSPEGTWRIVGVMPPDFQYPIATTAPTEVWVPYVVADSQRTRSARPSYTLGVIGRLKPGVSIAEAQNHMDTITATLARQYPDWFRDRGVSIRSLRDVVVGDSVRRWMMFLLGAVSLVLLIACVNVANLMLARGLARGPEMAIRSALGATRWQLARSMISESLVLTMAGALAGVAVAWWGVGALRAAVPASVPRLATVAVDLRVLVVTSVAAVASGLLCSLLPAFQLFRSAPSALGQRGNRAQTASRVQQRLRWCLVTTEVTLAATLVAAAALFVLSFVRVMSVDVGIDYHNVLTVPIEPHLDPKRLADPTLRRQEQQRVRALVQNVIERTKAVPGVEVVAAFSGGLPFSGFSGRTGVAVAGREFDEGVEIRQATPGYVAAVRLTVVHGRWISAGDTIGVPPVVVLNEEAERLYFEGRSALGQSIDARGPKTVIGIVNNVRWGGPEKEIRPEAYVAIAQADVLGTDLVLRTSIPPAALIPAVQAAVLEAWPGRTTEPVRPVILGETLERLVAQRRFNMLLVGLFGVLGLAIAAVGVHAVTAYVVNQRTREMGVRLVLGAKPHNLFVMVLGWASSSIMTGLTLGLAVAFVLSPHIEAYLFQVKSTDPWVYGAVAVLLTTVGVVAALMPAWRAATVDPVVVLKTE